MKIDKEESIQINKAKIQLKMNALIYLITVLNQILLY